MSLVSFDDVALKVGACMARSKGRAGCHSNSEKDSLWWKSMELDCKHDEYVASIHPKV